MRAKRRRHVETIASHHRVHPLCSQPLQLPASVPVGITLASNSQVRICKVVGDTAYQDWYCVETDTGTLIAGNQLPETQFGQTLEYFECLVDRTEPRLQKSPS